MAPKKVENLKKRGKVVAIIQARTGSTRLPGKVLMDLGGKTVLERVIERVSAATLIDQVVVATTQAKRDKPIVQLCRRLGIATYAGSELDVLDRYYQAAEKFSAGQIVRITADCPLIDHRLIDKVVRKHLQTRSDYTSNTLEETYPDGEDVEVFTREALENSLKNARLPSEREHVTPYMKKHPEIFKLTSVVANKNFSDKRWTLDEPRDYKFIKLLYQKLCWKRNFGINDILRFLKKHPEVEKINRGIIRNEGYIKSLRKDYLVFK